MVLQLILASLLMSLSHTQSSATFPFNESTIQDTHSAFHQNQLTSKQLVEFYLSKITKLNPILNGVIEVNPDAITEAIRADEDRNAQRPISESKLHGIPILLKDNIATSDKLNTTAGSLALLNSVVQRDAGVVKKLREAGAIILGKASMTEWANFRSGNMSNGWSARGGQGKNPYVLSADPCGSSSGSAISVASNMVMGSLGTETDGSIICPSSANSAVGIKPSVGLTSRAGVVPITPRQDTIGTVSDAVYVLDAIVGYDYRDAKATKKAAKHIPCGGYAQFLKSDGLKGKRLGIVRDSFFNNRVDESVSQAFENHFQTLRQKGAVLVDNVANISTLLDDDDDVSAEQIAIEAEFKVALNAYLCELKVSPVRSLADVIAFNNKFPDEEEIKQFGQDVFLSAEATDGIREREKKAIRDLKRLSKRFVKLMKKNNLDALVARGSDITTVLAIGGFPGISVPAAYDGNGVPVGICFGGLVGSEPSLIEIAYGFEQATKVRKPPAFLAELNNLEIQKPKD